jgi:hypothetical protein
VTVDVNPVCVNCKHYKVFIVNDGGTCKLDGADVCPNDKCHIVAFDPKEKP